MSKGSITSGGRITIRALDFDKVVIPSDPPNLIDADGATVRFDVDAQWMFSGCFCCGSLVAIRNEPDGLWRVTDVGLGLGFFVDTKGILRNDAQLGGRR